MKVMHKLLFSLSLSLSLSHTHTHTSVACHLRYHLVKESLPSILADLKTSKCSQTACLSASHSAVLSLDKISSYIISSSVCTARNYVTSQQKKKCYKNYHTFTLTINSPAKPISSISLFLERGPKHVAYTIGPSVKDW